MTIQLVLASASPRRLDLLRQIGLQPDLTAPTDIDESPMKGELPRQLALRLASSKCSVSASHHTDAFVLAADTVVACGRRILPKAESVEEASACLELLSGRGHDVMTAVSVAAPGGRTATRLVETRVWMKRMSRTEKDGYLESREWMGKAGGYAIQGRAASFVTRMTGSYSAVVGLPLYETACLLDGLGYPVDRRWPPQS